MELTERFSDLTKIHYLNSLTFSAFKQYCKSSCKNDVERKIQFDMMKRFCETNIKTRGETKRIYAYTLSTPLEVGGRLYCGNSIQSSSSKIRGFLMTHTTDIDMKSCHPVICEYLCKKHNIPTPNLSYYIKNRPAILAGFEADGKTLFLSALNDCKLNKKVKDKFFMDFDKECKFIQKELCNKDVYKHIVDTVPPAKAMYNWNGSAINRIFCVMENKILQNAISTINKRGIEIAVLMFDGIMVYGNYYGNNDLLTEIKREVSKEFEGLEMDFTYKAHDTTIIMPEDFRIPETKRTKDAFVEDPEFPSYETVKIDFELTYSLLIEQGCYTIETEKNTMLMPPCKFNTSFQMIKYYQPIFNENNEFVKNEDMPFIKKWVKDENIRKYDNIGVYPPPNKCPSNILNIWKPFYISTLKGECFISAMINVSILP